MTCSGADYSSLGDLRKIVDSYDKNLESERRSKLIQLNAEFRAFRLSTDPFNVLASAVPKCSLFAEKSNEVRDDFFFMKILSTSSSHRSGCILQLSRVSPMFVSRYGVKVQAVSNRLCDRMSLLALCTIGVFFVIISLFALVMAMGFIDWGCGWGTGVEAGTCIKSDNERVSTVRLEQ